MSNPLTFLLPLRYHGVRSALLVQSGPIEHTLAVAARVRSLFAGCRLHAVIREADVDAVPPHTFDEIVPARWEDRFTLVRRLRRDRYDLVVGILTMQGARGMAGLPYFLRTRSILMFNDHLDYFPVNLARLSTLTRHMGGGGSVGDTVRWIVGQAAVLPITTLILLASTTRLHLRAAWRRRGRDARALSPRE